jgi:hypothetical protein
VNRERGGTIARTLRILIRSGISATHEHDSETADGDNFRNWHSLPLLLPEQMACQCSMLAVWYWQHKDLGGKPAVPSVSAAHWAPAAAQSFLCDMTHHARPEGAMSFTWIRRWSKRRMSVAEWFKGGGSEGLVVVEAREAVQGFAGEPGRMGAITGNNSNRHSLTFIVSARNLLNHPNYGLPVGVLTSPAVGDRRLDLQLRPQLWAFVVLFNTAQQRLILRHHLRLRIVVTLWCSEFPLSSRFWQVSAPHMHLIPRDRSRSIRTEYGAVKKAFFNPRFIQFCKRVMASSG